MKSKIILSVGLILVSSLLLIGNTPSPETITTTTRDSEVIPSGKQVDLPSTPTPITNVSVDNKQVLYITGPIRDNVLETAKQITKLGKNNKPIYLLLESPGGSVMDGAQVIAAIQSSKVPVYTVVTGMCASMCAMIHQYGTERFMVDRSILMFHSAAGGVQGTLEHMDSLLKTITRYVYKMDSYTAKRAGLTLDEFHAKTIRDFWVDAEDATAQKFNDKIVSVNVENETPVLKLNIFTPEESIIKTKFNLDWR